MSFRVSPDVYMSSAPTSKIGVYSRTEAETRTKQTQNRQENAAGGAKHDGRANGAAVFNANGMKHNRNKP